MELNEPPRPEDLPELDPSPWTHMLTLNVGTNSARDWQLVWMSFCEISTEMGRIYPYVAVSSNQVTETAPEESDEPQLYADDETMHKVMHELLNAGLDGDAATHAISRMQNLGIVFQERL